MTNRIIQSFPFSTAYTTFEEWSGNFIQWYGKEAIGQASEDDWKEIAYQIVASPSFAVYGLQAPDKYENWQDWAEDVSLAINGPTR
jgi:hypothetical protein